VPDGHRLWVVSGQGLELQVEEPDPHGVCRENKCRRNHHQLMHVEKELEKERQGELSPVESCVAASVSGSAQVKVPRAAGCTVDPHP
jgi:hypothetical protein